MCIGEDHSKTGLLTCVLGRIIHRQVYGHGYWGGLFKDRSTDMGIGEAYSQTGLLTWVLGRLIHRKVY